MTTQYGNVNDTSGYAEAFYNAYKSGYEHVLQESKDVYAGVTAIDVLEGEKKFYDFVGTIELDKKTARFGDIPIDDINHNRRSMSPVWYRKGVYVDREDDIALHTDPTSSYIQALAKGVIRTKNDVIYAAFEATVNGDVAGTTDTYAFNDAVCAPTTAGGGRTIVHDTTSNYAAGGTSTGMSIEKLILAREALVQLKNDPNQMFNIVCSQRQMSDLLREAETQSIDTNIIRALHAGTISEYHGFRFIVDYNVTSETDGDIDGDEDIYSCYAFTSDALLFAQHMNPIFNVDWLPAKQIYQVSARVGMNAIRMDEDKVIKIECAVS